MHSALAAMSANSMLAQVPLRDDQTYIPGLLNSQGTKVGCMGCLRMALPLLPPPCTAPAVAASAAQHAAPAEHK